MRLNVLTIVLDGMPWLPCVFVELNRLFNIDWHWYIVHGAAMNVKDTSWMKGQLPRLSEDGTSEFLQNLTYHPCVTVLTSPRWEGKTEMCNAATKLMPSGVLLQVDCDELWTERQLREIVYNFRTNRFIQGMRFWCKYFVGPNLYASSRDSYGNREKHLGGEWCRAWRFTSGMQFDSHEPPVLAGNKGKFLSRDQTKSMQLVFQHYSWATSKQVAEKQKIYGDQYKNAVRDWRQLQVNSRWPLDDLNMYLPWVDKGTKVARLYEENEDKTKKV